MGTFVNHFNWLSGIFFAMALKYGQGVPIFQGEIYFFIFLFFGVMQVPWNHQWGHLEPLQLVALFSNGLEMK